MLLCQRCVSSLQLSLHHQHLSHLIRITALSQLTHLTENGMQRITWYMTTCSSFSTVKPLKYIHNPADSVYIWGNGETGALGIKKLYGIVQPYPDRLELKNNELPVSIALGYGFTVLATGKQNNSKVYAFGLNTSQQLGIQSGVCDPAPVSHFVPEPSLININKNNKQIGDYDGSEITDISCGKAHTWIVTDGNKVFSFGNNAYGQCGKPVNKEKVARIDDGFIFHKKIKQVCCGLDHTLLLTEDGNVYSCGLGADGQTGLGHYKTVDELSQVGGDIKGEKIISISSKADTVLALSENGDVFGWGNSEYGQFSAVIDKEMQVNVPRYLPLLKHKRIKQVAAAGTMCGLLDDSGNVYIWGYGLLGNCQELEQSSNPQLIDKCSFAAKQAVDPIHVVQLSCGLTHFAAVTELGDLYMWGKQRKYCLGAKQDGASLDVGTPNKVDIPAYVLAVSCGIDHSAALCMIKRG